jgi:predicted Zn-dependent protease with MMP-like domain
MAQSKSPEWTIIEAPSIDEIETMAKYAFKRLPQEFQKLCADVIIKVEELPAQEVLDDLDIDDELDLMGLFHGIGLAQGRAAVSGVLPNMVFLYRRPILDYWAGHHETLGAIVTHVLVHEIGHHFGLSDEDMARIEETAKR